MDSTFRIGRIGGIPVGVSWTWIPVFALFVWSLTVSIFPSTNPGLASGAYLAMAVAAALLFFGSLLLHDLGHAFVARREGVEIESITLWLLGGVARMRGRLPSAGAEFRIAVAGPLVSAVLATGFIAAAVLTTAGTAVDGVVAWLGYVNLVLAAFNLVPALPLDGGRILRAALWRARGDPSWATRIAAAIGIGIGAMMIGVGVIVALAASAFGGVWLALIGWFVLSSARAEAQMTSIEGALEGFVVADLMSPHPLISQADQTLSDFMAQIPPGDRSDAYPVLDGLRPVGILPSPRDVHGHDWAIERVRDRMVRLERVPLLRLDEPAPEAVLAMIRAHAASALVLDEGRLAGIVSSRDITEALKIGARQG